MKSYCPYCLYGFPITPKKIGKEMECPECKNTFNILAPEEYRKTYFVRQPVRSAYLFSYAAGVVLILAGIIALFQMDGGEVVYFLSGGGIALGIFFLIWTELEIRSTIYAFCLWGIMKRWGIFRKQRANMHIKDILRVNIDYGVMGRLFDYQNATFVNQYEYKDDPNLAGCLGSEFLDMHFFGVRDIESFIAAINAVLDKREKYKKGVKK